MERRIIHLNIADFSVAVERLIDTSLKGKPLIIAGGGFNAPGGREALRRLAERHGIPVAVSFRQHDLFPNTHALYAGDLDLATQAAHEEFYRNA